VAVRITKLDRELARRMTEARRIPCPRDVAELEPDQHGRMQETGELVSGPERMAQIDAMRLTLAADLTRRANQVASDLRAGYTVKPEELERATERKAEAARLRAYVRDFDKDREDIALRRGRHKPMAVHSPARPFASTTELQPTMDYACTVCGVVKTRGYHATVGSDGEELEGNLYLDPVPHCKDHPQAPMDRLWVRPELAERWALVQARAEAKDGVEYRYLTDEAGVWLGTVAVTHRGGGDEPDAVGFGALLEIAACAPTGPRDPSRIAESREAVQLAAADAMLESQLAVFAAVDRADALRRVEAEVDAHCRRAKMSRDLVTVEALYGGCEEPTVMTPAPRTKRTRRGRRGKGKGDRSTQRQKRAERAAGGPQTSNRASRKVLAVDAARKSEGRYYQGKALGSKRSV
jgi:hypothetical protein